METKTVEITQTKVLQVIGAVVAVLVIAAGSFALGRSTAGSSSQFGGPQQMQPGGSSGWGQQGSQGGQSGPGGQGQMPQGQMPGGQGPDSTPGQQSQQDGSSSRSQDDRDSTDN